MGIAIILLLIIIINNIRKMATLKKENESLNTSNESQKNQIRTLTIDTRNIKYSLIETEWSINNLNREINDNKILINSLFKENTNLKIIIDPSSGHDESNSLPSGRHVTKKTVIKLSDKYNVDDILSEIDKMGISKISKEKLIFLKSQSKNNG
jgi:homoserine trans-succinylase